MNHESICITNLESHRNTIAGIAIFLFDKDLTLTFAHLWAIFSKWNELSEEFDI